jgi:hypothetical protein
LRFAISKLSDSNVKIVFLNLPYKIDFSRHLIKAHIATPLWPIFEEDALDDTTDTPGMFSSPVMTQ